MRQQPNKTNYSTKLDRRLMYLKQLYLENKEREDIFHKKVHEIDVYIYTLIQDNFKPGEIARLLEIHPSDISRRLSRVRGGDL